jgi:hypothetical protein
MRGEARLAAEFDALGLCIGPDARGVPASPQRQASQGQARQNPSLRHRARCERNWSGWRCSQTMGSPATSLRGMRLACATARIACSMASRSAPQGASSSRFLAVGLRQDDVAEGNFGRGGARTTQLITVSISRGQHAALCQTAAAEAVRAWAPADRALPRSL